MVQEEEKSNDEQTLTVRVGGGADHDIQSHRAKSVPESVSEFGVGSPSRAASGGVCFYNWPNFGVNSPNGKYFCRTTGQDITQLPKDFNNAISSIRVFGGVSLRIYSDFNFRGASLLVRHDIADLKTVGWNNRISSMSIRPR